MPSLTTGALVEAGLLFLGGLVITLYAFGMLGTKHGSDRRGDRIRRWFRAGGPLLMIFAVLLLFAPPPPPPAPPQWRTVATSDGVCLVEMPGEPTEPENPAALERLAKGATQQWLLVEENGQVQYYLSHSDIEGEFAKLPPEKLLEAIAENWFRAANSKEDAKRVSEQELSDKGWPGRELVIDHEGNRLQNRWFVVNKRLYRAFVSTPADERHLQDAARFLASFRVLKPSPAEKGP
jgi:hypothetical protein